MKYAKTEAGQKALKDRSVPLSPGQRTAFILFDGSRSVEEVLAATQGMRVTLQDVERLVELGLLSAPQVSVPVAKAPVSTPAAAATRKALPSDAPASAKPKSSGAGPVERYQAAYPIATKLTSALGLRGFRLNLAVESAGGYEQLCDLAPKIKEAVGAENYVPLHRALFD